MAFKLSLKDWQKLLVPEFTIAAISIEERMVKVFCFDKTINKIIKVGKYALPLGIIEEGVLKKPQELKAFLNSLKQKLWPKEKNIWIILSLPSANFYTNILSLPDLEEGRFKDAVLFNTQMVAPLSLEEMYFDWEDWGIVNENNEREAFIALGVKKQIDAYLNIFNALNFNIIAVEPWALGLVRFLSTFGEKNKSVLSIALRPEGIEFILSENNKLIFFDFDSWPEIFGNNIPKQIALEMIQKHIESEVPMLLNFYYLKRKKPIEKFIFISDNNRITSFMSQWLKNTYKLEPLYLTLPNYMRWVSVDWASVIGTALRALIPRYQDTIVSLAPVGTEESYAQNHTYRVISLWSKVIIVVFLVVCSTFIGMDKFIFSSFENRIAENVKKPIDKVLADKELILKKEADEFNTLLKMFTTYNSIKKNWSEIINLIYNKANSYHINITRLFISNSPANNITIQGLGNNSQNIINFKNDLANSNKIVDINLPLDSLVTGPDGVSFNLNAKIP
ncbi:MAG: hypothetical protein ACP5PR_01555 [Minisyncoccia bacterium]